MTSHPAEETMVARLLGAASAAENEALDRHLAGCESCRAAQGQLRAVLELASMTDPPPQRGTEYGADVWLRIQPRILAEARARKTPVTWWKPPYRVERRTWAVAATMVVLLMAAFLAGRHWPVPAQPIPGPARERVLLVAVGDHLERAQMMLVELMNEGDQTAGGTGATGAVDISGMQQQAESLVADNRLYRQAAAGSKDNATAAVLDELERVLVDIAHRPSTVDAGELARIRRLIESNGVLFRVKVIGSQIREREKAASPARGST